MGRHAAARRLGAGQLTVIAVLGAVVAGAAGAGVVGMASRGTEPFESASSAVTASPVPVTPAPEATASEAPAGEATPAEAAAGADGVPRAAILTSTGKAGGVSTHVMAGAVRRTLAGQRPVRWFADGTLLLQNIAGAGETAVYDPVAGRFLARVPKVYAGLVSRSGPGAAAQSFFVPAERAGAAALVEVSHRLTERRTRLPQGERHREYRPAEAVRVGDSVFVPFGGVKTGGVTAGVKAAEKGAPAGVLRIRDGRTTAVLRDMQVERLAVSGDYRHLLALVRVDVPGAGPADARAFRLLAVDPQTGHVTRTIQLPESLARKAVEIGLIDRRGSEIAVQLGPAGDPASTWSWTAGTWTRAPGTRGVVLLWQTPDAALTWQLPAGPVVLVQDGRRLEVHGRSGPAVLVPGRLLRPTSLT